MINLRKLLAVQPPAKHHGQGEAVWEAIKSDALSPSPLRDGPGTYPITVGEAVLIAEIADLRHEMGVAKYGGPLRANNGRSFAADLIQELTDACAYSRGLYNETRIHEHWLLHVDAVVMLARALKVIQLPTEDETRAMLSGQTLAEQTARERHSVCECGQDIDPVTLRCPLEPDPMKLMEDLHIQACGNGGEDMRNCSPDCRKAQMLSFTGNRS